MVYPCSGIFIKSLMWVAVCEVSIFLLQLRKDADNNTFMCIYLYIEKMSGKYTQLLIGLNSEWLTMRQLDWEKWHKKRFLIVTFLFYFLPKACITFAT